MAYDIFWCLILRKMLHTVYFHLSLLALKWPLVDITEPFIAFKILYLLTVYGKRVVFRARTIFAHLFHTIKDHCYILLWHFSLKRKSPHPPSCSWQNYSFSWHVFAFLCLTQEADHKPAVPCGIRQGDSGRCVCDGHIYGSPPRALVILCSAGTMGTSGTGSDISSALSCRLLLQGARLHVLWEWFILLSRKRKKKVKSKIVWCQWEGTCPVWRDVIRRKRKESQNFPKNLRTRGVWRAVAAV